MHVAGTVTAGDFSGKMKNLGFCVQRLILYKAVESDGLSTRTICKIAQNEISDIVFFSPRTARTFVRLSKTAGMLECYKDVTVVCLSEAVATAVEEINWLRVFTTPAPTIEGMINFFRS